MGAFNSFATHFEKKIIGKDSGANNVGIQL